MESFELFPYEFCGNSDILGEFYISRSEIVIFHMEDEFVQSGNKFEEALYCIRSIKSGAGFSSSSETCPKKF